MLNSIKTEKFTVDENSTLGEILKDCRVKNNIELKQVSAMLNVKEIDIKNIEDNMLSFKKPKIYTEGLVRSYAKLLKIDSKLIKEKLVFTKNFEGSNNNKAINIDSENKYAPNVKHTIYSLTILVIIYLILFYGNNKTQIIETDLLIKLINNQ